MNDDDTATRRRRTLIMAVVILLASAIVGALCAVGSLIALHPSVCKPDRYGEPVCMWDSQTEVTR